MYDTGHPKLVLCDKLVGRRWEEGSTERGHMYTCGQFMLIYGKNHHSIEK